MRVMRTDLAIPSPTTFLLPSHGQGSSTAQHGRVDDFVDTRMLSDHAPSTTAYSECHRMSASLTEVWYTKIKAKIKELRDVLKVTYSAYDTMCGLGIDPNLGNASREALRRLLSRLRAYVNEYNTGLGFKRALTEFSRHADRARMLDTFARSRRDLVDSGPELFTLELRSAFANSNIQRPSSQSQESTSDYIQILNELAGDLPPVPLELPGDRDISVCTISDTGDACVVDLQLRTNYAACIAGVCVQRIVAEEEVTSPQMSEHIKAILTRGWKPGVQLANASTLVSHILRRLRSSTRDQSGSAVKADGLTLFLRRAARMLLHEGSITASARRLASIMNQIVAEEQARSSVKSLGLHRVDRMAKSHMEAASQQSHQLVPFTGANGPALQFAGDRLEVQPSVAAQDSSQVLNTAYQMILPLPRVSQHLISYTGASVHASSTTTSPAASETADAGSKPSVIAYIPFFTVDPPVPLSETMAAAIFQELNAESPGSDMGKMEDRPMSGDAKPAPADASYLSLLQSTQVLSGSLSAPALLRSTDVEGLASAFQRVVEDLQHPQGLSELALTDITGLGSCVEVSRWLRSLTPSHLLGLVLAQSPGTQDSGLPVSAVSSGNDTFTLSIGEQASPRLGVPRNSTLQSQPPQPSTRFTLSFCSALRSLLHRRGLLVSRLPVPTCKVYNSSSQPIPETATLPALAPLSFTPNALASAALKLRSFTHMNAILLSWLHEELLATALFSKTPMPELQHDYAFRPAEEPNSIAEELSQRFTPFLTQAASSSGRKRVKLGTAATRGEDERWEAIADWGGVEDLDPADLDDSSMDFLAQHLAGEQASLSAFDPPHLRSTHTNDPKASRHSFVTSHVSQPHVKLVMLDAFQQPAPSVADVAAIAACLWFRKTPKSAQGQSNSYVRLDIIVDLKGFQVAKVALTGCGSESIGTFIPAQGPIQGVDSENVMEIMRSHLARLLEITHSVPLCVVLAVRLVALCHNYFEIESVMG